MSPRTRRVSLAALILYLCLFTAPPGFAYMDPGSGSYLFQLLIAFFLGAGLAMKAFWGRIKAFFRRGDDAGSAEEER